LERWHRLKSQEPLRLQEVTGADGEKEYGSTAIDAHFETFLKELIGEESISRKFEASPYSSQLMKLYWEPKKREWDPANENIKLSLASHRFS